MYRLPNGTIVDGSSWVSIDGIQYLLNRMSDAELVSLGVVKIGNFDPRFYMLSPQGELVPRDLSDIKDTLKAQVATERYDREMGGITYNNIYFATDQQTRSVFTAAYFLALHNEQFYIPAFKVPSHLDSEGNPVASYFVSLSNADIQAIGLAIVTFIQTCFNQNAVIESAIDAIPDVAAAQAFTWTWE